MNKKDAEKIGELFINRALELTKPLLDDNESKVVDFFADNAILRINFTWETGVPGEDSLSFARLLKLKDVKEAEMEKLEYWDVMQKCIPMFSKAYVRKYYKLDEKLFLDEVSYVKKFYGKKPEVVFGVFENPVISSFEIFCVISLEDSPEERKIHKTKIAAKSMGLLEKFSDFESKLNEATVKGYRYHFNFEGKKYYITQGKDDKTLFGVKDKDTGKWKVLTKGDLFDPANNDMDRKEMIEFIQRGIKYFNIRNPVEVEDVKESEWAKFFKYELDNRPGRINKKYVIMKLQCGKAQAKWHTRER